MDTITKVGFVFVIFNIQPAMYKKGERDKIFVLALKIYNYVI